MKSSANISTPIKNQKCIINTDIDGIFSGLILHNFLNWEIVGFCDSAESIWLDKNRCNNLSDCFFIDMFVYPEKIKCIDQHIISVDMEHNNLLSQNKNKLNPNLINKRNFLPNSSYYKKYPFGTAHFIIAWLEKNGINIKLDLFKKVNNNILAIDLLLRADDALYTSTFSSYVENAKEWWEWLEDFSNKGNTTTELQQYVTDKRSQQSKTEIIKLKESIAKELMSKPFYCDSPDGGYKGEYSLGNQFLKPNVKEYISFVANSASLNCFKLDFSFTLINGIAKRTALTEKQLQQLKNGDSGNNLFSYAFVRTSKREEHFSYTLLDFK